MKRVSYVLAGFLAGSVITGGVAWAGTNYVSALKERATVHVNGGFATTGDALVYRGTTFAELYAIQQSLQQAGITTHWDGHDFNIDIPWLQKDLSTTVSLNSLSPASINSSYFSPELVNTFTDMFGNTYKGGMEIDTDGTDGHTYFDITYNLNGAYKQLTGTLVPDGSFRGAPNYPDLGHLTIIADGKTVYDSGSVTSGMTSPIKVSVDLTDVNTLEIRLEDGQTSAAPPNASNYNEYYGKLGFVGVNLYR